MTTADLWTFLIPGYLLTVAIELPVLWFALAPAHPPRHRFWAGFWLTACTYPIVVLVLPLVELPSVGRLWDARGAYLAIAETFAPLAECGLFWWAFDRDRATRVWLRDMVAIAAANLLSFGLGELIGRLL